MVPFHGWGSTASRLVPLRGGSLLSPLDIKFFYLPERDDTIVLFSIKIVLTVDFITTSKIRAISNLLIKMYILQSDCNWTRTQNHLVLKRTLNHLAKLVKCSLLYLTKFEKLKALKFWQFYRNFKLLLDADFCTIQAEATPTGPFLHALLD